MGDTYKQILKNRKMYFLFIAIIFCELYFFYIIHGQIFSCIDLYINTIGILYGKGLVILIFLLTLNMLINKFNKNSVLLRYENINLWFKDIFLNCINLSLIIVIVLNAMPVILLFFKGGLTTKDPLFLTMSIINQIISFIVISYMYTFIYFYLNSEAFTSIIIFSLIYIPKFVLDTFRKMYFTPVDIIFMRNMPYIYMAIQTCIMICIFALSVILFKKGLLNKIHKDIVWRD